MKFFYLLLLFLFTLPNLSSAQKSPLINSGKLIEKANTLYDSSQYKSAISLLNQINRSDTNYVRAVYEKALNCEADSQLTQGIKYCREALALKEQREYEPDILNIYGNTLSDLKQYDEALKVFDIAVAKYPHYALLYFNKGVVMMQKERLHDAEQLFQKALLINPYLYSAHYQLALVAVQQGKFIPAFLSSVAYLLVNPSGKYFSKSINILSQISKNADEITTLKSKRTETPDANYQMVEEIVLSKIAIDKQYKLLTSLDDVLARQIQVIFEKLDYDDKSKDFWIQYYLPYYKQVYKDGKLDPFIYHIFSNAKVEAIQDYNSKNKKAIEALTSGAAEYFNLIRSTQELTFTQRDTVSKKYVYENGKLVGQGRLSSDGKMLLGMWKFYYPGGNLKGLGDYSQTGNREGDWAFYTYTGQVKSKQHFVNGKSFGKQAFYYANGNPDAYEQQLNGQLEGVAINYYYNGSKRSEVNYKVGKKDGEERLYYDNGSLKATNIYNNGILTGAAKEYYKSGQLKAVGIYVNGKEDGPYKSYHTNGSISIELTMVKDKAEGEWKSYYENGKIKEKRNYLTNLEEGLHQEYYENSQLSATYSTKKGKINGLATNYSKEGKIYSKLLYNNGVITTAEYFDPAGKRLSASATKGNKIDIIAFSPDGLKKEHGIYNAKGLVAGADTVFYPSGKISQIAQYVDGELDGPFISYYLNGKKKSEINMTNGKQNGFYQRFYVNGQPEKEGWIQDGENQGEWVDYDISGKVIGKSYYVNSELNGYKETFEPNGKKVSEQKYVKDLLVEMKQYDDAGQVIAVDSFPKGSGKFRYLSPSGKEIAQGRLENGALNGVYKTFYFDGSPESIMFYKQGLLDSTYTSFFYGGIKQSEGRYANGSRVGKWQFYTDGGKLTRIANYTDDELNGEHIYYNPDGTKDLVSVYKDGSLDGLVQKFDIDGSLAYQTTFEDGTIKNYNYLGADGKLVPFVPVSNNNGIFKAYYTNGKVARECNYADGTKNGLMNIYYSSGQIRSLDNSIYGVNEGASKEYYPNGNLLSEYNYAADNLEGVGKEYYQNGKLKKEISYLNGNIHGPVKYYDENGKLTKTLIYNYDKLISATNEK
jgi:antitoxin component YwqK of YwqJK toxin-antitoxin module/Tfp pilus assembly protein PilF